MSLPVDPVDQLRGFQALYQNPFYLTLLASLVAEEQAATAEVFQAEPDPGNQHFKAVGMALGLARIKDLHVGKIADLQELVKEQQPPNEEQPTTKS